MARKKVKKEEDPENLRIENELKKIKMTLEKGAVFSSTDGKNELPPEVESEFLKNIEMYDKVFGSARQISLFDFIGRPLYKKSTEIPDLEIANELEKIMEVLNNNNIALDTICDVDERVLYEFITEELFLHEMDEMRIEGMVNHFIYEEFHPNHDYDIRSHSTDFIRSYLDKSSDYYTTFLTKDAEKDKSFRQFRDAFNTLILENFEILSLTIQELKASVVFKIDFLGIIEDSTEKVHYSGEGNIDLNYLYDFWCIQKVKFPLH